MLNILKQIAKISFVVIAFFSVQSTVLCAQVINPTTVPTVSVDISVTPENPKSGDNVTLQLSSYAINLDMAKITWYIDGVSKKDSIGQKSITIKAKSGGQTTAVRVVVSTANGITVESSTTITPAGVDLVIEPISYIPPFYLSRPLFTSQGIAKIVAMPDVYSGGKKIDSKNLIFKWTKDGTFLSKDSGMGKNSIIVNGTIPTKDIEVELEIVDSSGNPLVTGSAIVTVDSPIVLFYENNPLYGMLYNKAIVGSYYLGLREEVTIAAKPFYFNLSSDSGDDSVYNWTENGNTVNLSGKSNELILKQTTTNLKGTASVSLNLNNKVRIFQFTSSGFDVTFGQ